MSVSAVPVDIGDDVHINFIIEFTDTAGNSLNPIQKVSKFYYEESPDF